jgi:hypothetical protein
MSTWIIRTDESHTFRVRPLGGKEHDLQRIPPEGGVVAVPSKTLPGGPRGTSAAEILPAGARVSRVSTGDAYSTARWLVEVDE